VDPDPWSDLVTARVGVRAVARLLVVCLLASLLGVAASARTQAEPAGVRQVSATHQSMAAGQVAALGCLGPDALCDAAGDVAGGVLDGVDGGLDVLGGVKGGIDALGDIPNPFAALGEIIVKAVADAWTAAMLALWDAGLYVLRIVLEFGDMFLTPDLSADGPGREVYRFVLWLALALVVIMAMIQLGVAAFKRDGTSLARALIGSGQFVIVCASWFGYCVAVVAACGALTRALMKALLNVDSWSDWDPLGELGTHDVAEAAVATVLGLLGLVLWLAALAHLLIYLGRAAALLVLAATGPLAAAGLVADSGRAWFWKSLRWFHAAAFTPVLMVIVLGIGVQMAGGVATGMSDSTQKAIGTALPAVMLICISAVAPIALFKLLAFVDPGTPSGASFRQGLALQGGVQGLLSGTGGGGSTAAASSDDNGRSAGEQSAEDSTSSRFNDSTKKTVGGFGAAGQALAAGLGMVQSVGAKGSSLLADQTNQAGVGHQTYGPDFSSVRSGGQGGNWQGSRGQGGYVQDGGAPGGSGGPGDGPGGPAAGSSGTGAPTGPDGTQASSDGPADQSQGSPPIVGPPPMPTVLPAGGPGTAQGSSSGSDNKPTSGPKPPAGGSGGAGGGAAAGGATPPPVA
jgi:hypothetical protein